MKTHDGQNIFDVCLQGYGDLEKLFDLIVDNNVTVNTDFSSGQDVIIDYTEGNIQVKEFIKVNNIILKNRTYDNEIQTTPSLAIQWPVYVDLTEAININKIIQV